MPLAPGSLKLVCGCSTTRSLRPAIEAALRAHVPPDDIRHLHGDTYLVYTAAEPAAIRDWIASTLDESESVLVVEFERWSSRGPALDGAWLLRRGH